MKIKKLLMAVLISTAIIIPSLDSFAKGSSSSSSSSSRSSSSSSRSSNSTWSKPSSSSSSRPSNSTWSKPSTPKPSTPPSNSKPSNGGWSKPSDSIKTPLSPAKSSTASENARESAKQSSIKTGTAKINEQASIEKWKSVNKTTYKNKYDKEPTVKPSYIPSTYNAPNGGYSAPITYNQQYGGYGYMDALGTFILWDAMTDIAFQRNQVMSNPTYQVVEKTDTTTVVTTPEEDTTNPVIFIFGVLVIIGIGVFIFYRILESK